MQVGKNYAAHIEELRSQLKGVDMNHPKVNAQGSICSLYRCCHYDHIEHHFFISRIAQV
jgi:hypothetical protein